MTIGTVGFILAVISLIWQIITHFRTHGLNRRSYELNVLKPKLNEANTDARDRIEALEKYAGELKSWTRSVQRLQVGPRQQIKSLGTEWEMLNLASTDFPDDHKKMLRRVNEHLVNVWLDRQKRDEGFKDGLDSIAKAIAEECHRIEHREKQIAEINTRNDFTD